MTDDGLLLGERTFDSQRKMSGRGTVRPAPALARPTRRSDVADDTHEVHYYGCESRGWPMGSSHPGYTTSVGVYTDFRTERTFCADCAFMLLDWLDAGMPDQEDPDLSFPDWLDLTTVRLAS